MSLLYRIVIMLPVSVTFSTLVKKSCTLHKTKEPLEQINNHNHNFFVLKKKLNLSMHVRY